MLGFRVQDLNFVLGFRVQGLRVQNHHRTIQLADFLVDLTKRLFGRRFGGSGFIGFGVKGLGFGVGFRV